MYTARKRAVAPVIATLLMVAIAVVGGMLIFVFAQDFFAQSDMMAGPTIEQVQIIGYDTRDLTQSATVGVKNHAGAICTVGGTQDSILDDGEVFTVYVRNLGAQDVIISEVQVYGEIATSVATTPLSATNPAAGQWTVLLTDTCAAGVVNPAFTIGPAADATILIGYDEDWNGEIKVGRPIFLTIETGAGNTFTKQLINGRSS